MSLGRRVAWLTCILSPFVCIDPLFARQSELEPCLETAKRSLLEEPDDRSRRFLGKVREDTARCRGGDKAANYRDLPRVDWQNYYATGDASSKKAGRDAVTKLGQHLFPNGRGIDGPDRPGVSAHRADQVQSVRPGHLIKEYKDPHLLDFFMQSLWNDTQYNPLGQRYWSCVSYMLGEARP